MYNNVKYVKQAFTKVSVWNIIEWAVFVGHVSLILIKESYIVYNCYILLYHTHATVLLIV